MNKKLMFVLFAVLMMAVMTVSVSADRDGYNNWCNMDQYGCWVTGDEGQQNYIMFWSEEARTYFMGPNSKAVVTDYCADCNGKLGMANGANAVSSQGKSLDETLQNYWAKYENTIKSQWGVNSFEEYKAEYIKRN